MYLQASNSVKPAAGSVPANRTNFNLTTFAEETGGLTLLGATFFFVGPGNTTATNNATSSNSGSGSATASATSPAAPASSSVSSGSSVGAINFYLVTPIIWSILAPLFGSVVYFF